MKHNIKKVIILGSGALKIGEAGEFDYSGSQALKALREEGIKTVLINPNIATIQTSRGMADSIYFLPVTAHFVQSVIKKEKPDGILLGFGGQTALNCGLELAKKGVFKKYNVRILGTPINTIEVTEDRDLFKKKLQSFGLKTPLSTAVTTVSDALKAAKKLTFPVIIRSAFSLGGQGSAVLRNENELRTFAHTALATSPQILVEEYMVGWKEIEYEVVRDAADNCITVCNMENLDPMGIHTGESIVVAPSQTLTHEDYFGLRDISISCIRNLGVIGECNIQFAFNPDTSDYRIIEVNARLSRSSALASKATGYPLAFVAAKLALGYKLSELKNSVTRTTSAFFEPALDYIVVKMPRWDLKKLKFAFTAIGTEMKSVGEVMAIGRSFPESLQKAARMVTQGYDGIIHKPFTNKSLTELKKMLVEVTPDRVFILSAALYKGLSIKEAHRLTRINQWFLYQLQDIVNVYKKLEQTKKLDKNILITAKQYGFSDKQISLVAHLTENEVRQLRHKLTILPVIKQIDTLAGEFPAQTNYLYLTYHGIKHDVQRCKNSIVVLGGGPYHIGSSVEFDWCAVTTVQTLKQMGHNTIMINCNPETVSTDYDMSDRLYFDELSYERVLDIWEYENPKGIILSVGGQIPNNLAGQLCEAKVNILGTSPASIDMAENRHSFSQLLDTLTIEQPQWQELTNTSAIRAFADRVGYPLLIRPSYVLSGTAMLVAYTADDVDEFLRGRDSTWGYPVVISKFLDGAAEFDFDAVAQNGQILVSALCEHVEEGGVHSGDATLILPPLSVHLDTVRKIRQIAEKVAKELAITGPFNIQFLAKEGSVSVIECNLRASRSFPFCSKITKTNFIEIATRAMLGARIKQDPKLFFETQPLDYIGVKAPQFSFSRLRGADPILRVEMSSTGEVGCIGPTLEDAYLKSFLSVGNKLPKKSILITIGGDAQKQGFLDGVKILHSLGYELYGTAGTTSFYQAYGVPLKPLHKGYEGGDPNVLNYLSRKKIEMVFILSDKPDITEKRSTFRKELTDGYRMRRIAADLSIPIITNLQLARLFVRSISKIHNEDELSIMEWR